MDSYENILDNIMGGVIICDFDQTTLTSKVVYLNRGWTEITGYTVDELTNLHNGNPQALIHPLDKFETDEQYNEQIRYGNTYELMYRIMHKNGNIRWVVDKGIIKFLPNGIIQNQSIITEVTVIKEREEHLLQLAQTDLLTDLNNKATVTMLVKNTLQRQNEKNHALMVIDIDGFKSVNDTYGHAFGDKVLQFVAGKMKELFRNRDILGRVGGDEFMILMTDVPNIDVVIKKAENLCHEIQAASFSQMDNKSITISIGISFCPVNSFTFDELFTQADSALYQVKSKGRNGYLVYQDTTQTSNN